MKVEIKAPQVEEKYEPPKVFTKENVVYWSTHWKKLVVEGGDSAIGTKAKKFLENDCIEYDKEKKCYLCKPIPEYNKTTYEIKWNKELKEFECNCQYNQKTKRICSHILALYLQLKIWHSEKKNEEDNKSIL